MEKVIVTKINFSGNVETTTTQSMNENEQKAFIEDLTKKISEGLKDKSKE